uniref:CCHC-type domain-containing protein n=3 Tax=Macrostomum lignano TaxID=282301 RepID=A0A1I8HKK7_9PLAT
MTTTTTPGPLLGRAVAAAHSSQFPTMLSTTATPPPPQPPPPQRYYPRHPAFSSNRLGGIRSHSAETSFHIDRSLAGVLVIGGVLLFVSMSLTAAVIVFCKKKNTVFVLQKSDQDDDIAADDSDLELGDFLSEEREIDLGYFGWRQRSEAELCYTPLALCSLPRLQICVDASSGERRVRRCQSSDEEPPSDVGVLQNPHARDSRASLLLAGTLRCSQSALDDGAGAADVVFDRESGDKSTGLTRSHTCADTRVMTSASTTARLQRSCSQTEAATEHRLQLVPDSVRAVAELDGNRCIRGQSLHWKVDSRRHRRRDHVTSSRRRRCHRRCCRMIIATEQPNQLSLPVGLRHRPNSGKHHRNLTLCEVIARRWSGGETHRQRRRRRWTVGAVSGCTGASPVAEAVKNSLSVLSNGLRDLGSENSKQGEQKRGSCIELGSLSSSLADYRPPAVIARLTRVQQHWAPEHSQALAAHLRDRRQPKPRHLGQKTRQKLAPGQRQQLDEKSESFQHFSAGKCRCRFFAVDGGGDGGGALKIRQHRGSVRDASDAFKAPAKSCDEQLSAMSVKSPAPSARLSRSRRCLEAAPHFLNRPSTGDRADSSDSRASASSKSSARSASGAVRSFSLTTKQASRMQCAFLSNFCFKHGVSWHIDQKGQVYKAQLTKSDWLADTESVDPELDVIAVDGCRSGAEVSVPDVTDGPDDGRLPQTAAAAANRTAEALRLRLSLQAVTVDGFLLTVNSAEHFDTDTDPEFEEGDDSFFTDDEDETEQGGMEMQEVDEGLAAAHGATNVWHACHPGQDQKPNQDPEFLGMPGVNPDLPQPENADEDPVAFSRMFLTPELLQKLCDWTNARAWREFEDLQDEQLPSRFSSWKDVTQACLPRDRFQQISSLLRFYDCSNFDAADPLAKARPFINCVSRICRNVYMPEKELSVDEELVLFRGRVLFRQYIPAKKARYGIKIYCLCEAKTGYVCNFLVHSSRAENDKFGQDLGCEGLSMSEKVLVETCRYVLDLGYHVVCDSWFGSHRLADYLLHHGTLLTCTVRANRGVPVELRDLAVPAPGCAFMRSGSVLAVKYVVRKASGTKTVYFIDTKNAAAIQHVHRTIQGNQEVVELKPLTATSYNSFMGGVDKLDSGLQPYSPNRRTQKWFAKLGAHFFLVLKRLGCVPVRGGSYDFLKFLELTIKGFIQTTGPARSRQIQAQPGTGPNRQQHLLKRLRPTGAQARPAKRCRQCYKSGRMMLGMILKLFKTSPVASSPRAGRSVSSIRRRVCIRRTNLYTRYTRTPRYAQISSSTKRTAKPPALKRFSTSSITVDFELFSLTQSAESSDNIASSCTCESLLLTPVASSTSALVLAIDSRRNRLTSFLASSQVGRDTEFKVIRQDGERKDFTSHFTSKQCKNDKNTSNASCNHHTDMEFSSKRCCAATCTHTAQSLTDEGVAVRMHRFPADDGVANRWRQMLEIDLDIGAIRKMGLRPFNSTDGEPPQAEEQQTMPTANSSTNQGHAEQRSNNIIAQLRSKVRRQKTTIRQMQARIEKAKAVQSGSSSSIATRLMQQKIRRDVRSRGMRWTKKDIACSIQLHHKGSSAYRLVRNKWKIPLPSSSTIRRRIRQYFVLPGICNLTIRSLQSKFDASSTNQQRIATLCFDGMSLTPSLRYQQHRDVVVGCDPRTADDSKEQLPRPVNEAIVAVLRGVFQDWKQPIAYYPVFRTLGQEGFGIAIDECLTASHKAGIKVVALVADQESTQWAHLSRRADTANPFLRHPVTGEPVYVIVDIPHCLKNARNALMKNDIKFNECKLAKWQHLIQFYQNDSGPSLRLASKLTDAHFSLALGQKMKVSLAAQVLSHSVASGIRTLVHHNELSEDALQTAEFAKRLNDIFDMLNSAHLYGKGFQQPIHRDTLSAQIDRLTEAEDFVRSWRFLPLNGRAVKPTMPFKEGWLLSLSATKQLCTTLIRDHHFDYVCTRRFTQDHVENLFCIIRGHNGFNDRPELSSFVGALRSVAASGLAQPDSTSRNCEDDNCEAAIIAACAPTGAGDCVTTKAGPQNSSSVVCQAPQQQLLQKKLDSWQGASNVSLEAAEYVGGYVLKRSRVLHCQVCNSLLTASESAGVHIQHKTYSHAFRGLTAPSPVALVAFMKMEAEFAALTSSFIIQPRVAARFVNHLREQLVALPACELHHTRVSESAAAADCICFSAASRACSMLDIVSGLKRCFRSHMENSQRNTETMALAGIRSIVDALHWQAEIRVAKRNARHSIAQIGDELSPTRLPQLTIVALARITRLPQLQLVGERHSAVAVTDDKHVTLGSATDYGAPNCLNVPLRRLVAFDRLAAALQLAAPDAFDLEGDPLTRAQRWKTWTRRFNSYIRAAGITDATQQLELLVYTAGEKLEDFMDDNGVKKGESAEELIKKLQGIFDQKNSVVFLRYQFEICRQEEGESIEAWYHRLRKAADQCTFGELRDSLIRDKIVAHYRSERIRRELLQLNDVSLDDVLKRIRAREAAEQQAQAMEIGAAADTGHPSASNVAALRPPRNRPSHIQPGRLPRQETAASTAIAAGDQGIRPRNKACRRCGKMGHFARACRGAAKVPLRTVDEPQEEAPPGRVEYLQDDPIEHELFTLRNYGSTWTPATINGLKTKVLIDSGAACNIIDRAAYDRMPQKAALQPASDKVYPYGSQEPLRLLGKADLQVSVFEIHETLPFLVLDGEGACIIGRRSAERLQILRVGPENKVACQLRPSPEVSLDSMLTGIPKDVLHAPGAPALHELLTENAQVFSGIGRLKNYAARIFLEEGARPICHPPSRVPIHLAQAVDAELQCLEDQGIIEPVEGPCPWVARIVVVPKQTPGEIRITQDLRDLNKSVIRERHPIPTFEEVTGDMAGAQLFSELDIAKAFYQIPVADECRHLLTFSTPRGLRRLTRLCMGLSTAQEILQAVMSSVLAGLPKVKWIHDDIIVNVGEELDTLCIAAIVQAAIPNALSLSSVQESSLQDATIQAAIRSLETGRWSLESAETRSLHALRNELSAADGVLLRGQRIVVPMALRRLVLDLAHRGHQCLRKTVDRLSTKVWWPRMQTEAELFVRACRACAATSHAADVTAAPLKPTPIPKAAWLTLGADLLGPIQGSMLLANGITERLNRSINKVVRAAIAQKRDWRAALDEWLLAYRCTPQRTTNRAPAELLLGRVPNDAIPSIRPSRPVAIADRRLRQQDASSKAKGKRYTDKRRQARPHGLKVGDTVLRRRLNPLKGETPFEWTPWLVESVKGDSMTIRQGARVCRRHCTDLKRVAPDAEPDFPVGETAPPILQAAGSEPATPPIALRPHPREAKVKVNYRV